jgi:pimeloyl-ACP methyl ester carboxylesterase
MMEEATTVVLAALLLGIAVFSVYARSVVGGLGKFLVRANVNKQNAKAQLTFGEVTLASGTKAWFSERPAEEGSHLPPLVILPGATVSMEFMGAYMSTVLQEMPGRRICIIELPHHGRNLAENLDFSHPTSSVRGMVAYVEEVRQALGIEDNFDLMGYSLGGGIAAQYASGHPGSVRRLLLLAPYFYETAGDGFRDHMDRRDWRKVHGWESYEEMRHFFFYWLGMDPKSALPGLVLRGIHGLRHEAYPSGYWSLFYDALEEASGPSRTVLADTSDALAALQNPVLLVCAENDLVCDSVKLLQLQTIIGEDSCEVLQVECGHAFGPGGKTLFEIGQPAICEFFQAP